MHVIALFEKALAKACIQVNVFGSVLRLAPSLPSWDQIGFNASNRTML